jgi:uncharacterized MAPEG superfamily protein
MSTELGVLGLYGVWVIVVTIAQAVACQGQVGLPYLLGPRDEQRRFSGVAGRLVRALDNSVVAMALFAPAVLLVEIRGVSSGGTLVAAQAFLIVRVLYVLVYAAGIPGLRTLVWLVGVLATLWLYLAPFFAATAAPV